MTDEIIVPSNDEKNIATVTHLAGTIFFFIPSLIVWAIYKNENSFISDQAREALNFQITLLIAFLIAKILMWVLIGFALLLIIWLLNIVFCIIAAISTSKGVTYRYPICLRLIN